MLLDAIRKFVIVFAAWQSRRKHAMKLGKNPKTKATTNFAVSARIYFGLTVDIKCIDFFFTFVRIFYASLRFIVVCGV